METECTGKRVEFQELGNRESVTNFEGGMITSHGEDCCFQRLINGRISEYLSVNLPGTHFFEDCLTEISANIRHFRLWGFLSSYPSVLWNDIDLTVSLF